MKFTGHFLSLVLSFTLISQLSIQAQSTEPMIPGADSNDFYYQIPDYPKTFTAETVAARLVDGLGFRFYWATEGLGAVDLDYRPSEGGRSLGETIDHIYGLTLTILNATTSELNVPIDRSGMTIADLRSKALQNIEAASKNLKAADAGAIAEMKSIYQRREGGTVDYPFWNMLNGPIADAVYHTGQVVTFRRSAGNPISPNISVFNGRVRN